MKLPVSTLALVAVGFANLSCSTGSHLQTSDNHIPVSASSTRVTAPASKSDRRRIKIYNEIPTDDDDDGSGSATPDTPEPTFAPQTDPPTFKETDEPTPRPTDKPTPSPETDEPTPRPTDEPTFRPATEQPTPSPTTEPTQSPATPKPTTNPTTSPTTSMPTPSPLTRRPSVAPTDEPTIRSPTVAPTNTLTEPADDINSPTAQPSDYPSLMPSDYPSLMPSDFPSSIPSDFPSSIPSGVPSLMPSDYPSLAPTVIPSVLPSLTPTMVPSDNPSVATSTSPSESPSTAPTAVETSGVTASSSEGPSSAPSNQMRSNVPVIVTSSPNAPDQTKYDPIQENIVAAVQNMANPIEFVVELSIWSPNGIPKADTDFEPLSDAVLASIRMLYCEDPFVSVCVVRDDLLLTSKATFVSQTKQESAGRKTLVMPTIGKVVAVEEEQFTYTSWEVSIEVIQLGAQYVQEMIVQLQETKEHTTDELLILIPQMIQEKVTFDVESSILEGTFDGLLHGILEDDQIVSSVPGQEEATFGVLLPEQPVENTIEQGEATDSTEDTGTDLTLVAIYVAIGVCVIIFGACVLVLFYYKNIESESPADTTGRQKDTTSVGEESMGGADSDSTLTPATRLPHMQGVTSPAAMTSPSVTTESDAEDLSTAVASWQVKPRRFVLESDSQCPSESDHPASDDGIDFPTAGSVVAGSVMVGSMMAESVESSLDGWSVHATEINWA